MGTERLLDWKIRETLWGSFHFLLDQRLFTWGNAFTHPTPGGVGMSDWTAVAVTAD
jgi:hypothetical protein